MLKIAAFHVSDWLRSATTWALWMGPYICQHFPLTTEKIAPKLLRLFDLNLFPVGCDVSAYAFLLTIPFLFIIAENTGQHFKLSRIGD